MSYSKPLVTDIAIRVTKISKCYHVYATPRDRLKQFVLPKARHLFGLQSQNYYREFWALRDVSFEVKRGETIGIVGRNGAGKSTLLQLICGTLTPTGGNVEAFGRVSALLELGAGFNPEFTGRENLYLCGLMHGLASEQIEEKCDDILAFADIGYHIDLPVKTYSSGMFLRLAFSLATSVDPEILIVDEALSVGDAKFQMKCASRIRSMIERKQTTLLFVSHSEYSVRSLCEKALYLDRGQQVAFGPSDDIVALYNADMLCLSDEVFENRLDVKLPHSDEPAATNEALANQSRGNFKISIVDVELSDDRGEKINEVHSGEAVHLKFEYTVMGTLTEPVSFVFNLYRKDGVYVMGTTSLMEGMAPTDIDKNGVVAVSFPKMNLLSGYYDWRVAINDKTGLTILAEAKNVCKFRVIDNFTSVGVVDLERVWRL